MATKRKIDWERWFVLNTVLIVPVCAVPFLFFENNKLTLVTAFFLLLSTLPFCRAAEKTTREDQLEKAGFILRPSDERETFMVFDFKAEKIVREAVEKAKLHAEETAKPKAVEQANREAAEAAKRKARAEEDRRAGISDRSLEPNPTGGHAPSESQAFGIMLIVAGIIVTFYFAALYDTSVYSPSRYIPGAGYVGGERVVNLGKQQDRLIGVIIGVATTLGGIVVVCFPRRS